jgi:hypothetical protein
VEVLKSKITKFILRKIKTRDFSLPGRVGGEKKNKKQRAGRGIKASNFLFVLSAIVNLKNNAFCE